MKNPMLKRRLNPFLLASTVLVLSLLAGLAVTWQGQLSEIVSEKKNLSQTLEQKKNQIKRLKAEKSNLTERSRILQQTIDQLKAMNSHLNATIKQKEAKIVSLENIIDDREQTIQRLNRTNQELRENISEVKTAFLSVCDSEEDSGNITADSQDLCEQYFGDGYR